MDTVLNTPITSHTNINQSSSLFKKQLPKKDCDFGLIQLVMEKELKFETKKKKKVLKYFRTKNIILDLRVDATISQIKEGKSM
jgi:hypothetical protein|nr:MAG TPA: hypothetical protein [Caudoviricetes sp.]